MAKLSADTLMERETTIRWDELDHEATMFTASISVREEWQSLGYRVLAIKVGRGWTTVVPADRVAFKPLRKGTPSGERGKSK